MYGGHAFRLPLAQEFAGAIQNGNPAIAVPALAIRNVNITILRINENARRHKEDRGVGIERLTFYCAIGGIDDTLLADLKQHPAAVMRIFLDHPGGCTRNPDIVVLICTARMQARIEKLGIAAGIDDIPCRIELDDWRR